MVVFEVPVNNCSPVTIVLGRRGTYNTQEVTFDLSYLVENYGDGTAALMVKRSQDTSAYPAVVSQEDNILTWVVSDVDTYYPGSGECELMWYVDEGLAKTIIYPLVVMRDILQTTEEPPDGYENWIEHLTGLGAETQQNAQEAEQSATEAKASAKAAAESGKKAEDAADLLENVSATATTLEPWQPATAEYDEGVFKFGIPKGDKLTYADLTEADKDDLVQGPIKDAQDDAVEAVGTAKTNAVDAVNQAGTTQKDAVNQAGTTNKNAVTQEGTTQVNAVREAGTTQVGRVTTEGNTQVNRVQTKGDEVIASIPSDYSDLADDVSDLTRQLNDETTGLDTKAPVILETASGAIASFDDGADSMPVRKLVAQIEPVQDLHGYANPWPAGGGVNKLDAKERAAGIVNGITSQVYSNNRLVMSGTATASGDVYTLFNTTLFVPANSKLVVSWYGTDNRNGQLVVYLRNISGNFPYYISVSSNLHEAIFTVTDEQTIDAILFRTFNGSTITSFDCNVEVSFGEAAPATYSPYSNICPISGWTGAEIGNSGKNLFDKNASGINSGHALSPNTGNEYNAASYSVSDFIKVAPGSSYVTSGIGDSCDACFYNSAKQRIAGVANLNNGAIAPENSVWIKFDYKTASADTVQLKSNTTATDYAPYTGNQISVNWEDEAGTIYGGEDEVISGKLKSTMGMVDLGTLNWTYQQWGNGNTFYATINMKSVSSSEIANILCSQYKTVSANTLYLGADKSCANNGTFIRISDTAYTDAATFKTAMFGVQLCYELAEPVEYTLTGNEMDTLYGTNNIWASTGDTEVTYPADTKLYIDGKLAEIQATILENIGG